MSAPEPSPVELRPDLDEYRALIRPRLKFLIPLLLIALFRAAQDPVVGVIVIGGLGFVVALGIVHLRTSRIVLTPTTVEHRGLVVPDRVIRIDDTRGVLGTMTQPMGPDVATLVVQSRSTGRSLRIFGGIWNPDQLDTIARHARVERATAPMSGAAMDQYAPGGIPLRYRRPTLFGLGAGLVVVAAAIGLAIALTY